MKKFLRSLFIILLLAAGLYIYARYTYVNETPYVEPVPAVEKIAEHGSYTSKEDVALYIHTYGKLPSNFITKKEAKKLGWDSTKGSLWKYCEGCSLGGDVFTNQEGNLPISTIMARSVEQNASFFPTTDWSIIPMIIMKRLNCFTETDNEI